MSYTSSSDSDVFLDTPGAGRGGATHTAARAIHRRLSSANGDLAACLLLCVLVLLSSWQVAVQGYLPSAIDFILQYFPNISFLGQGLRSGEVPLWNPLAFSGTPYLADPQAGLLYLPNWPFVLIFDPISAARAIIVVHYLLATLSSYGYLRIIRLNPAPAVIGAIVYGVSEYTLILDTGIPLLINLAWIPVVLLLLELALQRRSARWGAAAGLALAMQLFNGWLPGVFITAIAVAATFLWHTIWRVVDARDWKPILDIARLGASTGLVWISLGAAVLLPALEFIGQSNYGIEKSLETSGGEGHVTVLALLGIGGIEGHGAYIGGIGLLLVLFGALFPSDRRRAWLYISLGGFSLLTAFGTKAPLYAYLYHWVPGFQTFHIPGRFMVLYLLSVSVLAAFGAQALLSGIRRRQLLVAGGVALLLVPPLNHTMSRMFSPEALSWLVENLTRWSEGPYLQAAVARHISIMGVLGIVFVVLRGMGRISVQPAYYSLLILLVVDLALIREIRAPDRVPPHEVLTIPPVASQLATKAEREGLFRVAAYPRDDEYHYLSDFPKHLVPELHTPNLGMAYGLEDAQGYNPLVLRRYAQYIGAINGEIENYHTAVISNYQTRLVDLLNVEYVALRGDIARLQNAPLATNIDLATSGESVTVHPRPVLASSISVYSYIGNSLEMTDGQVAARLRVRDAAGREEAFDLRAGIETSEWAFDRPDVRERVRHGRAEVSMSWNVPYPVHTYVVDLPLREPMTVAEITVERVEPGIHISVSEVSAAPVDGFDRYDLVGDYNGTKLFRNTHALPRALLVPQATVMQDPGEILEKLQSDDFDPWREVILEGQGVPAEQWTGLKSEGDAGSVQIASRTNNRIELSVQANSYGFLLLNEISYPGWNAYLDGAPARVWQANYLFRAVEIPPGEHEVEFRFEPDSLKLGLALTLPTLALLLVVAVSQLKTRGRSKRRQAHDDR